MRSLTAIKQIIPVITEVRYVCTQSTYSSSANVKYRHSKNTASALKIIPTKSRAGAETCRNASDELMPTLRPHPALRSHTATACLYRVTAAVCEVNSRFYSNDRKRTRAPVCVCSLFNRLIRPNEVLAVRVCPLRVSVKGIRFILYYFVPSHVCAERVKCVNEAL